MNAPDGRGNDPDLRKTGSDPNFWYPLARSRDVTKGRALGVRFGGEPIVLFRTEAGEVRALEDRCAHRQVPLSEGVVKGERLRCGYHGWTYDASGKCVDVPYLGKNRALPNGVRSYPCREAYDLIFVLPGSAASAPFPEVATHGDPDYKTRYLDRSIHCHYSFMHENLMDMNHQFLHRSLMGGIRPTLLAFDKGPDWVEARYTFSRVEGTGTLGEKFILGRMGGAEEDKDLMIVRTQYPYQTLAFRTSGSLKPALDLWLAYVPVDREQAFNHTLGLMSIRKPPIPGLIHLFWPFIVWFTDGIFAQDRRIVELEQQAHDAQGGDWNQEIFPVIRSLREILLARSVRF